MVFRLPPLLLFTFCLILFYTPSAGQSGSVPGGFVQNKGQITDQNGKPNTRVVAAYFDEQLDFLINADGFSYQIKSAGIPSAFQLTPDELATSYHRVDVTLENANSDFDVEFLDALPGEEKFITSNGTFSDVKKYLRIVFRSVYPNIDLEFTMAEDVRYPVKYNFILHEHARMVDIHLGYNGHESLGLIADGRSGGKDILLKTSLGELREEIPLSYWLNETELNEVDVHYVLTGPSTVGYALSPGQDVPEGKTLVIDPTPQINWSTYFGGTGIDQASVVKLDGFGFVYLAGSTNSAAGIATAGAHQITFSGGTASDLFIAKFDLSGNRIWTTYLGGSGDDQIFSLATDASANVYFTGSSTSVSGISTAGAYQTNNSGQSDLILGKFNSAGVLQWCTYLGGTLSDIGYSIQYRDASVFVVGTTVSISGIASAGASQNTYGGGTSDGVICRFSDTGALMWSTYFGGSGNDLLRGLDLDSAGNLVIAGYSSSSSGLTTAGVHQTAFSGFNDCVVANFTNTGSKIWCSYFGGSLSDLCLSVAVNSSDEIVLSGYTYSNSGMASAGAYDVTFGGAGDAFLNVFNSTGSRLWGTYYGGSGTDIGYALFIDGADNIFLVGNTNSASSISTPGAQQTSFGGGFADGLFAQFNTAGTLDWATYLGGSGDDYLRSIDVDEVAGAYAAGFSNSSAGISTSGVHQSALASGSNDAILVKYNNLSFLPLHIISFSATPSVDQQAVDCAWKVASESSCQEYLLEKSIDGDQWNLLGEIGCNGLSSFNEYLIRDESPMHGVNYYRICQIDLLGNIIDSKVAVVILRNDPDEILLYPIPTGDYLNLMVNRNDDQFCILNVYDSQGKLLLASPLNFIRGSNYFGMETASLPSGNYILQIVNPDGSFIQKNFIK
jgi:hypothetical protein